MNFVVAGTRVKGIDTGVAEVDPGALTEIVSFFAPLGFVVAAAPQTGSWASCANNGHCPARMDLVTAVRIGVSGIAGETGHAAALP